jgi:putative ABC transport system substrate-binding protein
MTTRREFITLLGGAAATWPVAARGQQGRVIRRVAVLMGGSPSDPEQRARADAFEDALQRAGWTRGRSVNLTYHWAGTDPEHFRARAIELAALTPEVILATNELALRAVREVTQTVPVVFVQISDPVRSGFVHSLARPDGHVTGFTNVEYSIGQKWLQYLRLIASAVSRATVLLHNETIAHLELLRMIKSAGDSYGIAVAATGVQHGDDIQSAVATAAADTGAGLIVLPHPVTLTHRTTIIQLAARHHLPAVYPYRYFATAGGLLSYGVDQIVQWRAAALYVDRILRGEMAGTLPVQTPTKFELVLNLNTAKLLELPVPATLLALADEVIE